MSVIQSPLQPAKRAGYKRRRGRLSRPGVSLMAQGEPLFCFTCGALATCVIMISGLLFMVVWYGLPTFWPDPLVLIEQTNGQKSLGEVARIEQFELTKETLASLQGDELAAAESQLRSVERFPVRRRLLRTG